MRSPSNFGKMNVLITLPGKLIQDIIEGRKIFEMRKSRPSLMRPDIDGFYVVEKGTNSVRCWCAAIGFWSVAITEENAKKYSAPLCVPPSYILRYAKKKNLVWLWEIGIVRIFKNMKREELGYKTNPQNYYYVTK